MLLYKQKKNQRAGRANRLLISINVLGSAGPIRFIVREGDLVASVIDTAVKSYAREECPSRSGLRSSTASSSTASMPDHMLWARGRLLAVMAVGISSSAKSPNECVLTEGLVFPRREEGIGRLGSASGRMGDDYRCLELHLEFSFSMLGQFATVLLRLSQSYDEPPNRKPLESQTLLKKA